MHQRRRLVLFKLRIKRLSEIEYQLFEGFPNKEVLARLTRINQEVFNFSETEEHLSSVLRGRGKTLIILAFKEGQVIGFKLGFEESPTTFDSWRGGVIESHRCQGVAQELIRLQHEWCSKSGMCTITTITNHHNIPMLIVNLRNGFQIVGTFINRRKMLKVQLHKYL